MELGEKLKQARLEAGLSQRQLCGEEITRNMLSLIENGTAKPSMKTLQYLAARLGKSVSYFLEEAAVVSPNQDIMAAARDKYDTGDYAGVLSALEGYQAPDTVYDREAEILWVLTYLVLAETAAKEGRERYAVQLLEKADRQTSYCSEALQRQRLLQLGGIQGPAVCQQLPSLDQELQLRAEAALASGNFERAAHLLEAMEHHGSARWHLLRGESYLAAKDYKNAVRCFHGAESAYPKETVPKLELCYRELRDYKRAYEYACKQK